jgi:inorganic pyrophosphatase
MAFPYNFGFVPSTRSGDGDPFDVLVLMDEPSSPGCKLTCRLVGVIEGEQGEGKRLERELEEFFANYHCLGGMQYRILAVKGPAAARACVKKTRKRAR